MYIRDTPEFPIDPRFLSIFRCQRLRGYLRGYGDRAVPTDRRSSQYMTYPPFRHFRSAQLLDGIPEISKHLRRCQVCQYVRLDLTVDQASEESRLV